VILPVESDLLLDPAQIVVGEGRGAAQFVGHARAIAVGIVGELRVVTVNLDFMMTI
jgi:hypothetical protein